MIVFPSKEWAAELSSKLNNNRDYSEAASDWEGSFRFVFEEEEGRLDQPFILWLDPWHGKIRSFEILGNLEEKESDFIMTGKYSTWKDVVKGEKEAMKLVMAGKLRLKGNMMYILKRPKASEALMKVLQSIQTGFIDEVS